MSNLTGSFLRALCLVCAFSSVCSVSFRARRTKLSESLISSDKWYTCAQEGETCTNCISNTVRLGEADSKRWQFQMADKNTIPCQTSFFNNTDPAPGVFKSCECQGERPVGMHFMQKDVCTGDNRPDSPRPGPPIVKLFAKIKTMPWVHDNGVVDATPLVTCSSKEADLAKSTGSNLHKAVDLFCEAGLGDQVEFFVDAGFQGNFDRLKNSDGWIPQAYVTYVGLQKEEDKIGQEVDLLVTSVHKFSTRPIVVTNFGRRVPESWTSARFPNMVLMHARPIAKRKSFNFNKLRAMMFTKVATGILIDADQFVNGGFDSIFKRTEDEITADYPLPMMPVHWLSRDPDGDDGYKSYSFKLKGIDAPKRTLRWGHAHPTWTHFALPFLAKYTTYALLPDREGTPNWVRAQGMWEDEDLMNVGLWAENATKQWCKFDIPGYEDYQKYFVQQKEMKICSDTKWYPKGIAFLYYSAHAAKDPVKTRDCLYDLFNETDSLALVKVGTATGKRPEVRKKILYDGKWFSTGQDLREYDPSLRCMA